MPIGAFTGSFDLPLLLVIVFTLFFFALVYYLQQEMKREGYPLVSERRDNRVDVVGFPGMPKPKTFVLPHGQGTVQAPKPEAPMPVPAPNAGNTTGMPVDTHAPSLGKNLGPGSWTPRKDAPDLTWTGSPVFRPMRHATDFRIMKGEADPRGFVVLGCDKVPAGRVVDVWIDESEHSAKFLEVALDPSLMGARGADLTPADPRTDASAPDAARDRQVVGLVVTETHVETPAGSVDVTEIEPLIAEAVARADARQRGERSGGEGRHDHVPGGDPSFGSPPAARESILIPMEFAAVSESTRSVRTGAITGAQFAGVPGRKYDLVLTQLEENRLRGYYGGGYLWATPARTEPLL